LAIEVFSKLPNQKLYISGIVDEKYLIKISQYPNIIYYGYLEYDKYIDLIEKIPIGLSLRDPNLPVNSNNFPSKILEYFTMGKMVLSTIDYPEIESFNYFKCKYSVEDIAEMITRIAEMPDTEIMKFFNHEKQLTNNFSESAWMKAFDKIEDKKSKI
ncbi:MAG: hypothetical protein KF721_15500, partial [Ignavibacteriaceae bacterium]|nr:hypothetical protein [Ignavibacteriaceae bacterium]